MVQSRGDNQMIIIYQSPSQTWLVIPPLPERGLCMAPERGDDFTLRVPFPVHCELLRRATLGSGETLDFSSCLYSARKSPLCWCQWYYCKKISLFHGNIRQDSGVQHSLKDNHNQTSTEIKQVLSFHVFSLIPHPSALDQALLWSLLFLPYHLQNIFSLSLFCWFLS